MQDPYFAVKEEVEATLSVVVDLHTKWLRLERKSDEFEWTSSELLSGLRSIEWDLQDLEDTVSIVEGNTAKFQLDASDIEVTACASNTRRPLAFGQERVTPCPCPERPSRRCAHSAQSYGSHCALLMAPCPPVSCVAGAEAVHRGHAQANCHDA